MDKLVRLYKLFLFWQWILIVLVLALTIIVSFYLFGTKDENANKIDGKALLETERFIDVQRGDLINTVSTTGSLGYPEKHEIVLGTTGTVSEVFVEPGDIIQVGQRLLRFDLATVAKLEELLLEAEIKLASAEDTFESAAIEKLILAQEESLRKAVDLVQVAELDLKSLERQWKLTLATSETDLEIKDDLYAQSLFGWLGISKKSLSDEDYLLDPALLLNKFEIDLSVLFNGELENKISYRQYASQGPVNDPNTYWDETLIWGWNNFHPEYIIGICSANDTPLGSRCVNNELKTAWSSFDNAKDYLEKNRALYSKAKINALTTLNSKLEAMDIVEQELEELQSNTRVLETELREAELFSAQIDVEELKNQLNIVAEVRGLVTRVNVQAGKSFNANATAVEIVDPNIIELEGQVDEIDVLFITLDNNATIVMDALAGQEIKGRVSYISPVAQTQNGIVTYTIRVAVDIPPGVTLLEGMSATASIITRQFNDVLLIPNSAVRGSYTNPYVRLETGNGNIVETSVTLGSSDDFWVVVQNGLKEGDKVVVEVLSDTEDPQDQLRGVFRASSGKPPQSGAQNQGKSK